MNPTSEGIILYGFAGGTPEPLPLTQGTVMKFEQLEGDNHVFSIEEKGKMISYHYPDKVHVISALSTFLTEFLLKQLGDNPGSPWVTEGVKSQLLKIGASQWIHGRVRYRIVVEFCPDEPEPSPPSELEEFRQ